MFDRVGNLCIGLVFGIALKLLFDNVWGLGVGVLLGTFFVIASSNLNRQLKRYLLLTR